MSGAKLALSDYTRNSVDDDLEARADDLDAAAAGWRWMEIGLWILAILAMAVTVVFVVADVAPWLSLVAGYLLGHLLSRGLATRRRRRRAVHESARLRSLVDPKRRMN